MQVSPDGKLAAFTANEGGTAAVWLRDFPSPQGKWRVSPPRGESPRWDPLGRYIYYWQPGDVDTLMRVRVDRTPSIVVRAPEVMATVDVAGIVNWDLHPDGKRFVVAVVDAPTATAGDPRAVAAPRYYVVLNWFEELKRLLRAAGQ
jgi:Tol biopolymer transport system component